MTDHLKHSPGKKEEDPKRRSFIRALLGVLGAAISGMLGVPLAGFYAIPVFRRQRFEWFEVGRMDGFKEGEIALSVLTPLKRPVWPEEPPKMAAYVWRRGPRDFVVFHTHCTHVGCPINWSPQAGRFFSPCHGGVFDKEGRVLAGPPPRPLDRHEHRIENGVLFAGPIYMVDENLERTGWLHQA